MMGAIEGALDKERESTLHVSAIPFNYLAYLPSLG